MGLPTTQLEPIKIRLDAIITDKRLQNRNVGMQKFKEHGDGKRYKGHVADLRRSIRAKGQQVPLRVIAAEEDCVWKLADGADKAHAEPTKYLLVDGHHRLEALQKEGILEAAVVVLPGLGLLDALDACRLSNQDVIQGMSPDERTENAWSAMNQQRDTYRRLPIHELVQILGVSESTIKRFRSAIRQDGIEEGKINPQASRDNAELQLQDYWNRKAKGHLELITWRMHKRGRRKPAGPSSAAANRHRIKMAVVQLLLGTDGEYELDDVIVALEELGADAQRPKAAEYLMKRYKPKISQPVNNDYDDEEILPEDHARLGHAVAALHAQQQAAIQAATAGVTTDF